jgi:hypothetical protein
MRNLLIKQLFAFALLPAGLLSIEAANASFVMMLDDPNDLTAATFIYDLGAGDLNPETGAITYVGGIGAFTVNVTTGVSKPLIGPSKLDLNSINVTGNAPGTLLVGLSDTDFYSTSQGLLASYGGTTQGSVSFNYLYSATNVAFGGSAFASDTFSATPTQLSFSRDIAATVGMSVPFSLSILAEINHTAASQVTSFDAAITPVPLPATVWLFASALFGGFFSTRKKSKQ